MSAQIGQDTSTTQRHSGRMSALMIAVVVAATLGAMTLVLQWYNSEVQTYNRAVEATIQATIGACSMGNIEFHMPAEAQAQVRAGCIKLQPLSESDEP